jgi:transposase InsO family protein
LSDAALLAHMRAIHEQVRGAYGSPRMWRALKAKGIAVSRERVERLMREHGIVARGKRKFKATTDSRHNLPTAPNVLDRQFTPQAPNERWAGDITYLDTGEGWLYLAIVVDLFSRRIIGWSFGERISRQLVIDALSMAWFARGGKAAVSEDGLLFHSDRGSQYASHDFQHRLTQYEITGSMSRKGNCWDNAEGRAALRPAL